MEYIFHATLLMILSLLREYLLNTIRCIFKGTPLIITTTTAHIGTPLISICPVAAITPHHIAPHLAGEALPLVLLLVVQANPVAQRALAALVGNLRVG